MKRHKHNLSHYRLMSGDMGNLYPVGLVEVLPGDTMQHRTNVLVRVSPMAAPVMHPINVRVHHFFVPNRILWDQWEDFITGGSDGANADTIPTIQTDGVTGGLLDHLGIPPTSGIDVNALPVRAYNLIYNEWYRDEDLAQERTEDDLTVAKVAWEKDYFTSARPWPQKGPDVTMPIGDTAPVSGIGKINQNYAGGPADVYETEGTGTRTFADSSIVGETNSDQQFRIENDPNNPGFPGIFADLAQATGVDVRDVRLAFAIQRYQEARARYGSRYTEYLRYLGVNPRDSRLQRPEFLGGGKATISISEVLQTSPEAIVEPETTPFGVGDMYGHGIASMRSNRYRRFFEEHGYVLTLLSVRPKAIYQDGINRTFLRQDKEDFYQKELAYIGQQAVKAQEVYAAAEQAVFGYQDRFSEYRHQSSTVAGDFRGTLDYWHLARQFTAEPALNETFVQCNPSKRIFNEQTEDALWVMCQHRIGARRMVPRNASARII